MLAFKPVLASFSASVFLYTVCLWLGLYLAWIFYFVFRNRTLKLKSYALTLTKHKPLYYKGLSLK